MNVATAQILTHKTMLLDELPPVLVILLGRCADLDRAPGQPAQAAGRERLWMAPLTHPLTAACAEAGALRASIGLWPPQRRLWQARRAQAPKVYRIPEAAGHQATSVPVAAGRTVHKCGC